MPGKPAVVQSAPEDPVYLFSPENFPEPSLLSGTFFPWFGGVLGFVSPVLHNFSMRRPYFSGIPVIVAATVAGAIFGTWFQKRNDAYFAQRDAVYRHYISLHPEDFPAKERVLVGDMLKSWVPIR